MGVVMLPHGTGSIKSCRKTYKREQAGRRAGNEASTAVPVNKMNSAEKELWRLRLNWFFFVSLGLLIVVSLTSPLPTLHQFITNPTAENFNSSGNSLKPGLGQSDVFYSLVIAFTSVGHIIASITTGFLITKNIPYWHLMLSGLVSYVVGYLFYATAVHGSMMLLARLFAGVYNGVTHTLVYAYFGQSFVEYVAALKELNRDCHPRCKDMLFSLHGISMSLGYIVGLGVPAIFSLFDIDQFRSVAWFNVALGVTFIGLQMLLLHGESKCRKCAKTWNNCFQTFKQLKLHVNWKATLLVLFLIFGFSAHATNFWVIETLFNPLLSDSFGMSEKYGSYLFYGLVLPSILGAITALVLQLMKIDTRAIAVIGLTIGITGTILMADWQSIPYDPCTELSLFHHPELAENYTLHRNFRMSVTHPNQSSEFLHIQQLQIFEESVHTVAKNRCEEARIRSHHCHWIPHSFISKHPCVDCPPICRSKDRSLNFVQFYLGALLFAFSLLLTGPAIVAIISSQIRQELQGMVMGLATTSNGIAVTIAPLWLDAAYEGVGKRTFLPMLLLLGTMLPFLVGLIVLYPWLAPGHSVDKRQEKEAPLMEDDEEVDATEQTQLVPEQ